MRELLFRGKMASNGSWVEGFVDYSPIQTAFFIHVVADIPPTDLEPGGDIYSERFEIIPETIGQYTGCKDMKGKDIFENDIVNVAYGTGKVVFHAGCFMIEWLDDKEANMELLTMEKFKTGHAREDLIVNGNIHDNPELLQPQN